MFRRQRNIRALTSLCLLAMATAAAAATPPRSLSNVIQQTSPLSAAEQKHVQEYVSYWTAQLAGDQSTAAEIAGAAQKLIDPPNASTASAVFLSAYSREAVPRLKSIIQSDNNFAAVQATKTMGFLGTPEALEEILNWCDSTNEKRAPVRLWAARGARVLLARTSKANVINERQLSSALRRLKQAAEDESDWLVLHRLFQALAVVGNDVARKRQMEVFKTVTRRLKRNGADSIQLMRSLTREMVSLRDQFIRMNDMQQQTQFGIDLAPVLGQVFEVAQTQWETGQADPKTKEIIGQAIQRSESLLRLIDRNVRSGSPPPTTNSYTAWHENDQTRFQSEMQHWMNILKAPPYRR